jgi:hypothetical protein
MRCIFGNPFRALSSLDFPMLNWNDCLIPRLAEAALVDRALPAGTLDPGRLAVLADALEDAGYTDEGVLTHLRGPGPHVKGCFALELMPAKAPAAQ